MRLAVSFICLLVSALHAAPSGTYRLAGRLELPEHPRALAYDTNRYSLVATGGREGFGYLVRVKGMANPALREVAGGAESLVSIVSAKSGLFVADRTQGLVRHIPSNRAGTRSQMRVGQYPGTIAVAPNGTFLCALSGCDWHPGVYDTGGALHILPIPLGAGRARVCQIPEERYGEPRSLCISPDGSTAYVATSPSDYGSATILAVDLARARIRAQHTVSEPCIWVSRHSLVLSATGQPILAIDGRKESRLVLFSNVLEPKRSLALGRGPTALATSPDALVGVVASRGANSLQTLDLAEFALGPPFPSPVDCPNLLSFGVDDDQLFVASSYTPDVACLARADGPPPALPTTDIGPREERIVYCVLVGESEKKLWAVRPDGTDKRLLARLPFASPYFVRVSPNGTRLLYPWRKETAWDLFALDLLTGENDRLTDAKRDQGVECMGVVDAAFIPHGRTIVYELEFTMHEKALVAASSQGGRAYPLVDHHDDLDTCPVPHPWDPDRLLFLYDSGNWTFNREIRLFDRDTDTEWVIRPRDGHTPDSPVWSLDGKHIYWGRSGIELESTVNLWSMRPDGTEAEPIVDIVTGFRLSRRPEAISPDGTRMLCGVEARGYYDVCIVDLVRRALKPLVVADRYEFPSAWQNIVVPPSPLHVP